MNGTDDEKSPFRGRGPLSGPAGLPDPESRGGTAELTFPERVTVAVEIPFHDCDPLGVVWHGRYVEYLEAARRKLLEAHGLGVFDIMQMNLRMLVSEVHCRYNSPLRYGDLCEVTCFFVPAAPLVRVAYRVKNRTTGRLAARCTTSLALTDDEGKLLVELPVLVRQRLESQGKA